VRNPDLISVITPAFNECSNLPALHARLVAALQPRDWEWIVVDDHSSDGTFDVIDRIASADSRVLGLRLARNAGSHAAIACGLQHARGAAAALVVADMQDPPELLASMVERWMDGAQIVWAVRRRKPGAPRSWFPAAYYWMLRRLAGLAAMPPGGVDFFVIDRVVLDAFLAHARRHVSVFVLLMALGFRQEFLEYEKQPRAAGKSGWTLSKKIALVLHSLQSVSDARSTADQRTGGSIWGVEKVTGRRVQEAAGLVPDRRRPDVPR
jgi:polyisoprenyl-phosphate glycosyltransferase